MDAMREPSSVRRTRLVARGGAPLVFELEAGDRCRIVDPEGRQPGLLLAAGGGLDAGDLSRVDLAEVAGEAACALAALVARGADAATIAGFRAFGADAQAGAEATFEAGRDPRRAPVGPPMEPQAQTPPTDLAVEIASAGPARGVAPAPLATPKLDLRVEASTARAYRVKAGDYIQIIDVDWRQCSDLLAFDAAALAEGEERGLDPTVTRTLMGAVSPGPGLHSKYFDDRLTPLVEIVRDTVGRHDAFMLACNTKYYDDMGYPGHDNCTVNFNAALAPFGVRPRAGWPAINFFYNTFVNADGSIGFDEPWSRPGDYVLLRALTDLVCATSSCADDIDPANGWSPTDIHVRVYDASENFSKGSAHRMTHDAEPRLTRESGFHPRASALTRAFVDYRGFWLADSYSAEGPIAEYWACRERAAIMDLSALRKFEVIGPDAEALMQLAVTRDMKKLAVGQVVYTAMCHEHGGMIDDGTVFRLGERNFRWVCGDDYCGVHLRNLAAARSFHVVGQTSTDQLHNLAVQGPRARDILAPDHGRAAGCDARRTQIWFRFHDRNLAAFRVVVFAHRLYGRARL